MPRGLGALGREAGQGSGLMGLGVWGTEGGRCLLGPDQGVMTVGREIRAGRDRKYRPPAPMAGRFWRRCKGEHGLWEGKIALKVRTLEDEVFQIGHVDIGVTSINVPKSFRGVWGGRLSCVSLEIRVIYRRNGFPLGCQTKNSYPRRRKKDR